MDQHKSLNKMYFKRADRAIYELGYLLRQVPPSLSSLEPQSEETYDIAGAAAQHADNAIDTLLEGLEAFGALLAVNEQNAEKSLSKRQIASVGALLSHVAIELQFLRETHAAMTAIIQSQVVFNSTNSEELQG